MKKLLLLTTLLSISMWILTHKKMKQVIEFTDYKCIPGLIEHCESRTIVKDQFMFNFDREYRDSIYNLILEN